MANLVKATITTAGTVAGSTFQLRSLSGGNSPPPNVVAQLTFTYGSGGTTVDTYLQTSLDGGTTWVDVVHFPQNTTSSTRSVASVNSSGGGAAPVTATDGTQTVNTINQGLVGPWWRVKYVSVGTYAGNTTLRVDVFANGLVPAGVGA